ncbi:MAG TPA: ParB N-terminal domain-containing protein [Lacipirellulaceae bacterium]|nr:ParB N-terminal domain-containing protein [Lacipirellulaceae bacterium]
MHIRDRIKELRRVQAADLRPNPRNWRTHPPQQQDALRGLLAEVGYADALLARELRDGTLMLIDGHLRAETTPDAIVPVLILDVDEAEADKILLTHDPIAGMATVSHDHLQELLANVQTENAAVRSLLDGLVESQVSDVREKIAERPEVIVPESYQIVVECRDEADQKAVFERMRAEGYRCRVLTL